MQGKLLFAEHHESHAASAFFPSPFEEAVVLTMDGVGEWATTSVSIGRGNTIEAKREIRWPHSLGLLYSAFTYYTGFKVNSGEYKVMGLAPYGDPKYADLILANVVDLKSDGSFWLDQSYFNYATGLTMTSPKFHELFGGPPRDVDSKLTQRDMDLAASVQKVTEEIMLRMTRELAKTYGIKNLCLAGGVALNCVGNGKVLRDGAFERIWVQPAAGDAGGSLGAALAAYHGHHKQPRHLDGAARRYVRDLPGTGVHASRDRDAAHGDGRQIRCCSLSAELLGHACDALEAGHAVGWFQGRMEFGPRALGARSILGDPRSPHMQKTLNLKIKYRESFRPFAPSVLRDDVADYFELDDGQPLHAVRRGCETEPPLAASTRYEDRLFGIEKLDVVRSDIPAVTHVDYSARVQTVHVETNPRYHRLLSEFKRRTGCAVLVNTSFNVRGEPIVCTPEDAFRCFMGTEMETLSSVTAFSRRMPRIKLS